MPYRCASRWFAAFAVCAGLLGCGGSETADESARFAMPQSATQPSVAPRMRVLAAPPSPITASQLFAWAEQAYPEIFPTGPATEPLKYQGVAYTVRHYVQTQTYLGVDDNTGVIYATGPFNANQLLSYGLIADYACAVSSAHCSPPLGKNRFTTVVDGDSREYFVHLPKGYDALTPLPVVFMLHGSGGNGEKFYNTSGWVETGEAHNVITVFPSARSYDCVFDDGRNKRDVAKWTGYDLELCSGTTDHFRDDVKFLGQVIDELNSRLRVDTRRVYLVGFSNGGEMAGRAAAELGDRLAAVVTNGGALDRAVTPKRREMPITVQVGNKDTNLITALGISELPMDFAQLFASYPSIQGFIGVHQQTFDLQSAYTVSGNGNVATATYAGRSGRVDHLFRFTLVRNLGHEYPNGINHPMKGAEEHWAWLKNFSLP